MISLSSITTSTQEKPENEKKAGIMSTQEENPYSLHVSESVGYEGN